MSESRLTPPATPAELATLLEAMLFVADGVVPLEALAEASQCDASAIDEGLALLAAALEGRGLRLQRTGSGVQLVTAPDLSLWIERFLGLELESKLSTAALETLSIVAYGQPLTRAEIEAVRGVNSSGVLRTLIQRELVEEVGRLETVGHPYLYGTTAAFLQYFGLDSIDGLPPLETEEQSSLLATLEAERMAG
ncbi:MAG: SMC-Scp complex subunit ScpB [Anaerolineales bacterium]|nr:SMC-Scp complex subunit ScpB [Anaerolineales bacterium]MCB9127147.1 SMC-Scp complex subunit ScpB [Ardenticatenales bacterium]MCB9171907.1 SMC-Scp complex subunit ScpB [Ardenticatenales bacterium]